MKASASSSARLATLVIGLGMVALGALSTYNLLVPKTARIGFAVSDLLALFGPCLCVVGGLLTVKGIRWRFRVSSRHVILGTGLVLVAVGGFPWAYTPMLTEDQPGGEAAIVTGTFVFVLVGLPGILLTIVGGVLTVSGLRARSGRKPPPRRNHRPGRAPVR